MLPLQHPSATATAASSTNFSSHMFSVTQTLVMLFLSSKNTPLLLVHFTTKPSRTWPSAFARSLTGVRAFIRNHTQYSRWSFTPVAPDPSLPSVPTPHSHTQLISYIDSAYGNDLRKVSSTTGYRECLAGGIVVYRCKTQPIVAQSSTETELVPAYACAKVTKFLRYVLHELGSPE